jgi:hypothetical protein
LSAGFADSFRAKRLSRDTIKSKRESAADASNVILQLMIQNVNFTTARRKAQKLAILTAFFASFIYLFGSF